MTASSKDTAEYPPVAGAAPGAETVETVAVGVQFGAVSHQGLVRENNEDHYAVARRTRSREILLTNVDTSDLLLADDHVYVLIVADGVGGRGFGELASELVLRIGWELSGRQPAWLMKFDPGRWKEIRDQIDLYVRGIQKTLQEHAQASPKLAGMGTTWTCAYVMDADAVIIHAGDSRAYRFRQGELKQLTHDHTFAQELQDMGMPADETKRFKHILTNSFGGTKEEVETEVGYVRLENGDRLLLCTDGLTDMLSDDEIANVLRVPCPPQECCEGLLDQALRRGGKDNVTIVLADFQVLGAAAK